MVSKRPKSFVSQDKQCWEDAMMAALLLDLSGTFEVL